MPDVFAGESISLISPVEGVAAVTPDDTAELAVCSRAIYVGTGGDVKITTVDGNVVVLKNLSAGVFHPIRARLIWQNGTTAADIVVGW